MEYRNQRLTLSGELNQGLAQSTGAGAAVDATWRVDDRWSVSGRGATNSFSMPLRGVRHGTNAHELSARSRYRVRDWSTINVSAGMLNMDDSNRRRWLGAQ